jgi:hypothetical protein
VAKRISGKKPDKDIPALKELIDKASLKDIGAYFGVGESGVSQACRRVIEKKIKV